MIAANKSVDCAEQCHPSRCLRGWILLPALLAILIPADLAWAQTAGAPAASASPEASRQSAPEISSKEESTTFKVKVNLVEVRVVVRDAQGHAIGGLQQSDFQLFDNGKPQVISKFNVESAADKAMIHQEAIPPTAVSEQNSEGPAAAAVSLPERYVAYLFDDIHLSVSDLSQARNAAIKQLQSLPATERAAIYTTSGLKQLDFTDDRAQLLATINRIVPHPLDPSGTTPCPNISYYQADLIENKHDQIALLMAVQDATDCGAAPTAAEAQAEARRVLMVGDQEVRTSLGVLQAIIRRMAALPGQRSIILVSPGFMNQDELRMQTEVAERGLHSNIVINTLDARGLFTNTPDVSVERPPSAATAGKMMEYMIAEQQADQDILAELADATGGTFFHNNNDLSEGFRRLASPPEYSYLLGFSPHDLKLDGHYHKLKVTLKPPAKGTVQARKGYFAPEGATSPTEVARQAIEDAVFSREEVREIPIELHTQFFKPDDNDAKLSVVAVSGVVLA